jgi:hypothetical protein
MIALAMQPISKRELLTAILVCKGEASSHQVSLPRPNCGFGTLNPQLVSRMRVAGLLLEFELHQLEQMYYANNVGFIQVVGGVHLTARELNLANEFAAICTKFAFAN